MYWVPQYTTRMLRATIYLYIYISLSIYKHVNYNHPLRAGLYSLDQPCEHSQRGNNVRPLSSVYVESICVGWPTGWRYGWMPANLMQWESQYEQVKKWNHVEAYRVKCCQMLAITPMRICKVQVLRPPLLDAPHAPCRPMWYRFALHGNDSNAK